MGHTRGTPLRSDRWAARALVNVNVNVNVNVKDGGLSASEITTSVAHRDEIVVLGVVGEIDAYSAPALEAAIAAVLADEPVALIIDLSSVGFLGTNALRILAEVNEQVTTSGRFAVVANSPATSKPIQLTGLDKLFSLYPTLDDAITGVRNAPL